MKTYLTTSVEETKRLAEKFAKRLKGDEVIGLTGELGAGKTSFIQGLSRGLSVAKNIYVSSPTFTILKIYPGDFTIFHFDFYRLNSQDELTDIGFDDYLKEEGIAVIEWADKFRESLPRGFIEIKFEVVDENSRRITFP